MSVKIQLSDLIPTLTKSINRLYLDAQLFVPLIFFKFFLLIKFEYRFEIRSFFEAAGAHKIIFRKKINKTHLRWDPD